MNLAFTKIAAFFMAAGIGLGAFGAHGLADKLTAKDLSIFEKAVFYHLIHALALLAINTSEPLKTALTATSLRNLNLLICFGIVVFSGSLYTLVMTNQRWLGAITPIGGVSFILGWLYLAWSLSNFD